MATPVNRHVPGMSDILPAQSGAWQKIEATAREIFSRYGFREMRTPLLEETGLFARGIGEATQVVQKEMYTFLDRGGDSVTLRPEGTAGVVRAYAEHNLQREDPLLKVYYMGPMFRYERPQKGRLRQFHQIGAEIFGTPNAAADAELIIMLARFTQALGIKDFTIDINNLGDENEREKYRTTLVTFLRTVADKLCEQCRERIDKNPLRILDCKNAVCQALLDGAPRLSDHLGEVSRAHFDIVRQRLQAAGIAFHENPRLVRGLDYYDLTAFEFNSAALGSQSAFAGGGRYNRLVEELGGPATPAVGFAIGCERLLMMMAAARPADAEPPHIPGVFFVALDAAAFQLAQNEVQRLRDAGFAAEMAYETRSLKSQMKHADRSRLSHAAIIGENELKSGTVMLKNMGTGEQKSLPLKDLEIFCRTYGETHPYKSCLLRGA